MGESNVPETELSVARGIGVPVGQRLEGTVQPGPLDDKGGQSWVGHCGCWLTGFGCGGGEVLWMRSW